MGGGDTARVREKLREDYKEYKGRVTWKRAGKRGGGEGIIKSARIQRAVRKGFWGEGGTASGIGNSVRSTEG